LHAPARLALELPARPVARPLLSLPPPDHQPPALPLAADVGADLAGPSAAGSGAALLAASTAASEPGESPAGSSPASSMPGSQGEVPGRCAMPSYAAMRVHTQIARPACCNSLV